MTTVEYKKTCALCGQTVQIEGFTLTTQQGEQAFCCAGCQCIYDLIYADASTETSISKTITNNNEED